MTDRVTPGSGPLDLNQLRTFLAVHRAGSLTAAAHQLGLSQSTVTAQVRALEQRLGRELFERRARGVSPLPYADDLAARLSAPLDQLAGVAAGPDGAAPEPVHLAGPAEFLGTVLLGALAPLVAEGVQLRVTTGLTDPLLDELRTGRHDLVVATRRPRGRTLLAEPLADEEFVLVAAPVWAERLAGRELPAALAEVPLLSYAEDLPIARRYWRHVFDRRLHARAAVTVPDLRAVLAAVTAGAGWSVLPGYLCRSELASGALRLLHQPADPPINTAYLVRRPAGSANPHVALVRERLLDAARRCGC
ncbi:DNA-binding transcriptional LysR family regulator [Kitasatospora sp. MAA19]|uniref:LysR family transcriptional regulator n=1 Tax=unclassified Kitasatospora TaxID=2633591 RepID=UPI0024731D74|nr:LysR family transcriptional regulator [Kitasatospora sp. MAA19]MDH6709000.1 DNA-binding transcriptional LysR family regulator [Kitasatospora sp. MAA19]